MNQGNYTKVVEICKVHCDNNPKLWTDALTLFSQESVTIQGQDTKYLLDEVLSNIEERNLLSPLGVIQIMSKNRSATVGMVKVVIFSYQCVGHDYPSHRSRKGHTGSRQETCS
jgi:hypothetical protein